MSEATNSSVLMSNKVHTAGVQSKFWVPAVEPEVASSSTDVIVTDLVEVQTVVFSQTLKTQFYIGVAGGHSGV